MWACVLVWDLDPEGIGAEPNKKKKKPCDGERILRLYIGLLYRIYRVRRLYRGVAIFWV